MKDSLFDKPIFSKPNSLLQDNLSILEPNSIQDYNFLGNSPVSLKLNSPFMNSNLSFHGKDLRSPYTEGIKQLMEFDQYLKNNDKDSDQNNNDTNSSYQKDKHTRELNSSRSIAQEIGPTSPVFSDSDNQSYEKGFRLKDENHRIRIDPREIKKLEEEKNASRKFKIRKTRKNGCNCKSSNCLKLHCACFKDLGYCKPTCRCDNCLNKIEFNSIRTFVIEKLKFIFSDAFSNHNYVTVKSENGEDIKIKKVGCNCKSSCKKNYCACRKINGRCSYICKCIDCQNDKIKLDKKDIQKFYKPKTRKKHKILINYNEDERKRGGKKQVIEFKVYSNAKPKLN